MKRLITTLAFMIAAAASAQSSRRPAAQGFASDFQTVPVMGNVAGANNSRFQTYVALLNPTASAFSVEATLHEPGGATRTATIALAAGELKTFPNFLDAVFGYSGGGAVTFRAPESAGGTHNNRFILDVEVWTSGGPRYGTSIPALEFAGSSSRSFAPGISTDSGARTNIGCFDQSGAANRVHATVLDKSGQLTLGAVDLDVDANGWAQTAITTIVSDGVVRFEPAGSAVCYAVVVNNTTNDGRFISATEYQP
ncbi:MAG TPA: hypothetical protein VF824_11425 [Thermoanaerobaculia bacterium]|jgi:hypothetical protein